MLLTSLDTVKSGDPLGSSVVLLLLTNHEKNDEIVPTENGKIPVVVYSTDIP
jgi:hypothetical protein